MSTITPQILLKAYAAGIFPMAESAEDNALYWVEPEERGIIPLDGLHISHSLRKRIRQRRFDIRIDTAFAAVIAACAERSPGRTSTWINGRIRSLYGQLHKMGCCHSVECWHDGELVGGLYGVRIGAAFFGESMFSRDDRCEQGGARPSGGAAQGRRLSCCSMRSSSTPHLETPRREADIARRLSQTARRGDRKGCGFPAFQGRRRPCGRSCVSTDSG